LRESSSLANLKEEKKMARAQSAAGGIGFHSKQPSYDHNVFESQYAHDNVFAASHGSKKLKPKGNKKIYKTIEPKDKYSVASSCKQFSTVSAAEFLTPQKGMRRSYQAPKAHWAKSPATAFRKVSPEREKRIDQNKRNDSQPIFSPGLIDEQIFRKMYSYKKLPSAATTLS